MPDAYIWQIITLHSNLMFTGKLLSKLLSSWIPIAGYGNWRTSPWAKYPTKSAASVLFDYLQLLNRLLPQY